MFSTIFKHEIKYWFKKPSFYIYLGIFFLLGILTSAASAGMAKNIQTETANRDQATIQGAREMSLRTGEDISIAESLHFEANAMGTSKGAELGVQKTSGLDAVSDKSAFEAQRSLSSVSMAVKTTGASAESIGKNIGATTAMKNISDGSVGQSISSNDQLNETGKSAASFEAKKKESEIEAQANSQLKEKDIRDSASVQVNEGISKDSTFMRTMRAEHKQLVNDLKAEGFNDKQIDAMLAARAGNTEGMKQFENLIHNQRRIGEIVGQNHVHQNEDGSISLDQEGTKKLTNYATSNARTNVYNERVKQNEVAEYKKEGVSAKEKGTANADKGIKEMEDTKNFVEAATKVTGEDSVKKAAHEATRMQDLTLESNGEVRQIKVDSNTGKTITGTISAGLNYNEAGSIIHNAARNFIKNSGLGKGMTEEQLDKAAERVNKNIQNLGGVYRNISSASHFAQVLSGNSRKVGTIISTALVGMVAANELKGIDHKKLGQDFIKSLSNAGSTAEKAVNDLTNTAKNTLKGK